jgi:hypothetical protein
MVFMHFFNFAKVKFVENKKQHSLFNQKVNEKLWNFSTFQMNFPVNAVGWLKSFGWPKHAEKIC